MYISRYRDIHVSICRYMYTYIYIYVYTSTGGAADKEKDIYIYVDILIYRDMLRHIETCRFPMYLSKSI